MNNTGGIGGVEKKYQIDTECEQLGREVESCCKSFVELTEKLTPILRNEPSQAPKDVSEKPVLVPLALRIQTESSRMRVLSTEILELINRIEL